LQAPHPLRRTASHRSSHCGRAHKATISLSDWRTIGKRKC
jgi:hypothetical protein